MNRMSALVHASTALCLILALGATAVAEPKAPPYNPTVPGDRPSTDPDFARSGGTGPMGGSVFEKVSGQYQKQKCNLVDGCGNEGANDQDDLAKRIHQGYEDEKKKLEAAREQQAKQKEREQQLSSKEREHFPGRKNKDELTPAEKAELNRMRHGGFVCVGTFSDCIERPGRGENNQTQPPSRKSGSGGGSAGIPPATPTPTSSGCPMNGVCSFLQPDGSTIIRTKVNGETTDWYQKWPDGKHQQKDPSTDTNKAPTDSKTYPETDNHTKNAASNITGKVTGKDQANNKNEHSNVTGQSFKGKEASNGKADLAKPGSPDSLSRGKEIKLGHGGTKTALAESSTISGKTPGLKTSSSDVGTKVSVTVRTADAASKAASNAAGKAASNAASNAASRIPVVQVRIPGR